METNALRAVRISLFLILTFAFILNSDAGSATWDLNSTSGDWNTAANWTPDTVPNGSTQTATFAESNTPEVALSASTTVKNIVFSPGASAFTISTYLEALEIEGKGMINNSGVTQQFLVPIDPSGSHGLLEFFNTAKAGNNTAYSIEGSEAATDGGQINFWNSSSANGASFVLQGGGSHARTTGGRVFFNDTSTAGNGTFDCQSGGSGNFGGSFAAVIFNDTSSAGNATLTAEPAVDNSSFYGTVVFEGESSAANATLIAMGPQNREGGVLFFSESSTGDRATVKILGTGTMWMHVITGPTLTIGSLEGEGTLFMESKNLVVGSNNSDTSFTGAIEGSGSLTKIGTGVFILAENGKRVHTGPLIVEGGALLAGISAAPATGSGPVQVNHGAFGGKGQVAGAVTVGDGTGPGAFLSPGIHGAGVLTIQSSLTFKDSSQCNWDLEATLVEADQTIAKGVTIGSGVLFAPHVRGDMPLPTGTVFTVLSNTDSTPIAGTFGNLPDGGTITVGSNTFQANYEGGDGNDLTLTIL